MKETVISVISDVSQGDYCKEQCSVLEVQMGAAVQGLSQLGASGLLGPPLNVSMEKPEGEGPTNQLQETLQVGPGG